MAGASDDKKPPSPIAKYNEILTSHGARSTLYAMAERNASQKSINIADLQKVVSRSFPEDEISQQKAMKILQIAVGVINNQGTLPDDEIIQRNIIQNLAHETDSQLMPLVDRMAKMTHVDLHSFDNSNSKTPLPQELSKFLGNAVLDSDVKVALQTLIQMRCNDNTTITLNEIDSLFTDALRTIWKMKIQQTL